jgi:hypothetical protein
MESVRWCVPKKFRYHSSEVSCLLAAINWLRRDIPRSDFLPLSLLFVAMLRRAGHQGAVMYGADAL